MLQKHNYRQLNSIFCLLPSADKRYAPGSSLISHRSSLFAPRALLPAPRAPRPAPRALLRPNHRFQTFNKKGIEKNKTKVLIYFCEKLMKLNLLFTASCKILSFGNPPILASSPRALLPAPSAPRPAFQHRYFSFYLLLTPYSFLPVSNAASASLICRFALSCDLKICRMIPWRSIT